MIRTTIHGLLLVVLALLMLSATALQVSSAPADCPTVIDLPHQEVGAPGSALTGAVGLTIDGCIPSLLENLGSQQDLITDGATLPRACFEQPGGAPP